MAEKEKGPSGWLIAPFKIFTHFSWQGFQFSETLFWSLSPLFSIAYMLLDCGDLLTIGQE